MKCKVIIFLRVFYVILVLLTFIYLLKIIKLHTVDSTNTFLKDLSKETVLENYTVVTALEQTSARGQADNIWQSEKCKNLLISILIKELTLDLDSKNNLIFTISLAIFNVLNSYKIPNLQIKWPNDILSGNRKLCGILIENSLKGNKIDSSIIGIGLNVNQKRFPNDLPRAISMIHFLKTKTNLDILLEKIINSIKFQFSLLENKKFELLETNYLQVLYRKNIPTMFKNSQNMLFLGIIKGVSKNGKLQVLLEDDTIKEFAIKEIFFA